MGRWWFGGLVGLAVVGLISGDASAALSFTINPSRGAGTAEAAPAPLGVFFETDISNENFLKWRCVWDFDDPNAGSWRNTGLSKNTAIGPIAAHAFESPGTYQVTLSCSDGNQTGTDTVAIYVDDPDAVFAGTETICFSKSGNFSGCPSGALAVTDANGDFDQAIGSRLAPGKRLLLRRGETWTANASVEIDFGGPGMVGAFGSGAKPVIQSTMTTNDAPVWKLNGAQDWRWADLEFVGGGGGSVNFCGGECGQQTKNVNLTWVRVDSSGYKRTSMLGHWALQPAAIGHDGLLWFGGVLRGIGQNIIFNAGERMAYIDLDLKDGFHNLRTLGTKNSVFQHINDQEGAADTTIRGVHGMMSERIVVSDNRFTHGVKITPNNSSNDSHIRYVIYERNWHDNNTLQFQATDSEIRHNVCTRTNDNCFQIGDGWSSIAPDPSNVRVFFNSAYRSGTSSTPMVLFQNNIGSGNVCSKNYVYAPAAGNVSACSDSASGGTVAISGNLDNGAFSTSPFVASPPARPEEFNLNNNPGGGAVVMAAGIPSGLFVGAYDDSIFPPPTSGGAGPVDPDTDGDTLPDVWESSFGLNPSDPADAAADGDNDGLVNTEEFAAGTDPTNPDTDGDGVDDGTEVAAGTDPTDATSGGSSGSPGDPGTTVGGPCADPDPDAIFCEDFESRTTGINLPGWIDTGPSNSLVEDDALFEVTDLAGNRVLSTVSTATDIHSHYVTSESANWSSYEVRGRMRVSSTGSRIGVTAFSQFDREARLYRLSSHWTTGELELHAYPSFTVAERDCVSKGTGVIPRPDTWYRFRFRLEPGTGQNRLMATVWEDGSSEPTAWQAECVHFANQPTAGTIGAWSGGSGAKYWDDLEVIDLGVDPQPAPPPEPPASPEPLGMPGTPTIVP